MTDERLDEIMREVALTYHEPPSAPPYEEMWQAIERELPNRGRKPDLAVIPFPDRRSPAVPRWLQMAAVLVIGIGLGRVSPVLQQRLAEPTISPSPTAAVPAAYSGVTDRYLGETAALLIALPAELRSNTIDSVFNARADELLLQTRLLLDSPAASDPALRTLFEDLEMILVQIVRLQAGRDSTHIELLNEALERGNVIPRLRTAVVEHIGD